MNGPVVSRTVYPSEREKNLMPITLVNLMSMDCLVEGCFPHFALDLCLSRFPMGFGPTFLDWNSQSNTHLPEESLQVAPGVNTEGFW